MLARAHLRLEKSSSFAMRVRYLARPTNSLSVPLFLCASLQMAFQFKCNIPHFCAPECPDLEALLGVHEEVSPQVIKHNCGFLVILRVLAPDHPQRLHINNPILFCLN